MAKGPGIWTAAIATKRINACARGDNLRLIYKVHAREQMFARDLLIQDVLHVLRFGSFMMKERNQRNQTILSTALRGNPQIAVGGWFD